MDPAQTDRIPVNPRLTAATCGAAPGSPAGPQFNATLLGRILLVWLAVCAIMLLANIKSIMRLNFPDPDDALRLIQVRDWLAGQPWSDLHQYRIAAPEGVLMHWSRLVDLPLAGLIVVLRPLLGQPMAETVTIIVVPLLTLLCALLLIGRLVGRLFDVETAGFACLLAGMAIPAMNQMRPLRIDHHGWQIVLTLLALNGMAGRDARRSGWIVGLALAASLAISIEGLPLAAIFIGVAALRALRNPASLPWLTHITASLATSATALFLISHLGTDLVNHCDSISPVHVAVFIWSAAGCAIMARIRPHSLPVMLGTLAVIGVGAVAITAVGAPQCSRGAFAELDPVVRRYWYNAVLEGLPVWRMPIGNATMMIAIPLFGLIAGIRLARRADTIAARDWWVDYCLILGGATIIGLLVARASATTCLLSTIAASWQLRERIEAARDIRRPMHKIIALIGIVLLIFPLLPVMIAAFAMPADKAPEGARKALSTCNFPVAATALNRLPATDIFAPLDIGPTVLVRTHHRVIATSHHRGHEAMRDLIEAFIGSPEAAREIVHRRHATLVMVCPDIPEPRVYARVAPDGLMAHLLANRPPEWLQPVDLAPGSNIRFWRVVG
jgi:hypothetical protein